MVKVSFDFDGTLDQEEVQVYAKQLLEEGVDVYICTYRVEKDWDCTDINKIKNKLGIKNNTIFTGYKLKLPFLKGFVWHLDDLETEVADNWIIYKEGWKERCEQLLKNTGIRNL